jgi:hypothetical protein
MHFNPAIRWNVIHPFVWQHLGEEPAITEQFAKRVFF